MENGESFYVCLWKEWEIGETRDDKIGEYDRR